MNPPRRRIKRSEWLAVAKQLFPTSPYDIVFRCVQCGHEQSINSAKEAGIDISNAQSWIYFSCEGRHAAQDRWGQPEYGCDWSLGGLFQIHTLEIIDDRPESDPDFVPGKAIPCFEFATASVLGERI